MNEVNVQLKSAWDAYVLAHSADPETNPIGYTKDISEAKSDLHYALFDALLEEHTCNNNYDERCKVGFLLEKAQWQKLTFEQLRDIVDRVNL